MTVTLARKAGETDQLFGSVTAADLAEALAAQGFEVDKRRIQLDEPIKVVGEYDGDREAGAWRDRDVQGHRRARRLDFAEPAGRFFAALDCS